jgi:hypothetical protein
MLKATYDPVAKRVVYKNDSAAVSLPEISVGPAAAPTPGPSPAPASNAGGGMMRLPLGSYLQQLEQSRGLPQGFLAQTRAVESSNGRNTANPNSSARGDFQFITSTARKYGVNVNDPYDSARGAADLAADNAKYFQNKFGRTPTGQDLYGMHQQGAGGYANLLNGQAPGGAAQSLNGGAGMNASGFLAKIHGIYNNAKPDLPGDPTTKSGGGIPTQAAADAANAPLPGSQGPTFQPPGSATPAAPVAAAPDPAQQKYTGGIIGLMQGSDYTGAGSGKDFAGKMGDFTNSGAFTSGVKGLMSAMGGGGAPTIKAPGIQPTGDDENKPNLSLLQMLYGRGMMGGGMA